MWSILNLMFLLFFFKVKKYYLGVCFSLFFLLKVFFLDFSFKKIFSSKIVLEEMKMWFILLVLVIFFFLSFSYFKNNLMKIVMMFLSFFLILAFFVKSIFYYFVFFELSLLPTCFLMLVWGVQPERLEAVSYFLIYALFGSFPLLINIVKLIVKLGDYMFLMKFDYKTEYFLLFKEKKVVIFFWILSFFMKLPIYSLHLWLPKAHVEAPVMGSMVLAAMLLKLGGYGLIRLSNFFLLKKKIALTWMMMSVSVVSFITLRSKDVKALMAYSSIAHMALTIFLFLFMSKISVFGALVVLMGHGYISSALFFKFKMFYKLTQSRKIFLKKGNKKMSSMLFFFFFFLLCLKSSLPLNLAFFSEMVVSKVLFYSLGAGMIFFFVISVLLMGLYKMKIFLKNFHGGYSKILKKLKKSSIYNKNLMIIYLHIVVNFFFVFFFNTVI